MHAEKACTRTACGRESALVNISGCTIDIIIIYSSSWLTYGRQHSLITVRARNLLANITIHSSVKCEFELSAQLPRFTQYKNEILESFIALFHGTQLTFKISYCSNLL